MLFLTSHSPLALVVCVGALFGLSYVRYQGMEILLIGRGNNPGRRPGLAHAAHARAAGAVRAITARF